MQFFVRTDMILPNNPNVITWGLLQHFYDIYNYDIICYRCLVTGSILMLRWTVGKWSGTEGSFARGMDYVMVLQEMPTPSCSCSG